MKLFSVIFLLFCLNFSHSWAMGVDPGPFGFLPPTGMYYPNIQANLPLECLNAPIGGMPGTCDFASRGNSYYSQIYYQPMYNQSLPWNFYQSPWEVNQTMASNYYLPIGDGSPMVYGEVGTPYWAMNSSTSYFPSSGYSQTVLPQYRTYQ